MTLQYQVYAQQLSACLEAYCSAHVLDQASLCVYLSTQRHAQAESLIRGLQGDCMGNLVADAFYKEPLIT